MIELTRLNKNQPEREFFENGGNFDLIWEMGSADEGGKGKGKTTPGCVEWLAYGVMQCCVCMW